MDRTKIDSAIATLQEYTHKTVCLHWAIRVGKSHGLQEFLRTSDFEPSRVLLVNHNPEAAAEHYTEVLGITYKCVSDLTGIEDGDFDCIVVDEIEWVVSSYDEGITLYERALDIVSEEGYVIVAGTQNYGICDELKDRVSFYSKITTPDVHPNFLNEIKAHTLKGAECPAFRRDYLLELTDEKI